MLQLLSPLALVALASLAVPALLHLWRPPAKTVRIGTLRYFSGPAVRRLNKLRWRERLLLLVRLLLLTMLVLLLARPIWNKPPPTTAQRWILVEPGLAIEGEAQNRWNALRRAGYEAKQLITSAASDEFDIWSVVRELDARLPRGSELVVFASSRIASLRGERPLLRNTKVEWIMASSSPNGSKDSLLSVQSTARGELHCVVATSGPEATQRTRATIPATPGPHAIDRLTIEARQNSDGSFAARLPGSEWIVAQPYKPLKVLILHTSDRAEDARYIEAAARAAVEAAGRAADVESKAFAPDIAIHAADWFFWLSDEPVPQQLVNDVRTRGVDLLQDAEGGRDRSVATSESIIVPPIELLRRTPAVEGGVAIWTDTSGQPVLTTDRTGGGRHWRFFSRFHPDWNDLVRSSALAVALRSLFGNDTELPRSADLRHADSTQPPPAEAMGRTDLLKIDAARERVDLQQLFWIIAALLFLIERVLSFRAPGGAAASGAAVKRVEEAPVLAAGQTR